MAITETTIDLSAIRKRNVAAVKKATRSICGLGQAAPNPLRCAIKHFPQEFK